MTHQPLPSILDAIGNTPLVRLDRLTQHHGRDGTILAKLDHRCIIKMRGIYYSP